MYYVPISFHVYLSIICYQMTVVKAVTLPKTISALKFLLIQKMDNICIYACINLFNVGQIYINVNKKHALY